LLYGNLNILYTVGDINIVWHAITAIRQLLIKLSLTINDNPTYIIEIIVEAILKNFLLFGFTIGLLCVSAGLFLRINNVNTIPITSFTLLGTTIFKQIIGTPKNIIDETTKQIQLFVACNPNDGILIKLYSRVNINNSLTIPKIQAIAIITINFVTNKYIETRPYLISAIFSSVISELFFLIKFSE